MSNCEIIYMMYCLVNFFIPNCISPFLIHFNLQIIFFSSCPFNRYLYHFFIYVPTVDIIPSNVKNIPINLFTKSQRDYNTCRRHKRRICHAYYFTGCFDGYIISHSVLSFSNGLGTSCTSRICYEFLICLNIWKIGNCKSA